MKQAATTLKEKILENGTEKELLPVLANIIERDIYLMQGYTLLARSQTPQAQEFIETYRNDFLKGVQSPEEIMIYAKLYGKNERHLEQYHLLSFLKENYRLPEATYELGMLYSGRKCKFMKSSEQTDYESSLKTQECFSLAAAQELDIKTQHLAKLQLAYIARSGKMSEKEQAYKLFDELSTSPHLDDTSKQSSIFHKAKLIQTGYGPDGFGCNPRKCGVTNPSLAKHYWLAKMNNDVAAQDLYMQLETQEHARGTLELGFMAYKYEGKVFADERRAGINKKKNDRWAYKLFQKTEKKGSGRTRAEAIHWQARMISEDRGESRNAEKAIELFEKAGLPSPYYRIGQIYQYGLGGVNEKGKVEANRDKAIENYRKAYAFAPEPLVMSAVRFNKSPITFSVTAQDRGKEHFLKIVENEPLVSNRQVMAHYCLAKILFQESDYEGAFKHMSIAARCNLANAKYRQAYMIDQGFAPGGRDRKEAFRLMYLLTKQHPADPRAQYYCGCCLEKENPDEALTLFKAAAGAGSCVYIETNRYSSSFDIRNTSNIKTLFSEKNFQSSHRSTVYGMGNRLESGNHDDDNTPKDDTFGV